MSESPKLASVFGTTHDAVAVPAQAAETREPGQRDLGFRGSFEDIVTEIYPWELKDLAPEGVRIRLEVK